MRPSSRSFLLALTALPILAAGAAGAAAQRAPASVSAPAPADRAVYLDGHGVIRWADDHREVSLFGVNYVLPTASDYRAAGYLHLDRKRLIDEDMAQLARMGFDGLRLTFWGDWEASDSAGNLIANDHLDLLDYLIAQARARGIYMLLSPIQLYDANWPDATGHETDRGFGRYFGKQKMGTDPAAIAAQVNYLKQLLDHVNPYTGVALKDEPAILFIELVNEPWHHPEDLQGSIRYINALTDAVRSTGCRKLIFYNVSQDFRIAEAIRRSEAQGVTFAWYPTGLNNGHELEGDYLRSVDAYPPMLAPDLAGLPRIVYEFDSPDLRTGYMYPAMARTFREVGAQFAAMFAYDMLGTASRNLAWQTHYLNLVYTPRKAMSAVVAAEVMRRLPLYRRYGPYPADTAFGDFRVSYAQNLGELVARDAFLYAGSTTSTPPDPAALTRIAGYGSSPLVRYEGKGIYFLDKVRPGVWRLEVYPDAVPVADPFAPPNPDKLVTRAISRAWPMTVTLPDLGGAFTVQPVTAGNPAPEQAAGGRFTVTPGVYVLSAAGPVALNTMPAFIGHVGFAEYHAPPADTMPPVVTSLAAPQYLAGQDATIEARVVERVPPDSVTLFLRPVTPPFYRAYPMRPAGAYRYAATVPAAALRPGPHRFVVTIWRKDSAGRDTATTFPGALPVPPTAWDYYGTSAWRLDVVEPGTPLALFDPGRGRDVSRLALTRGAGFGLSGVTLSRADGRPVFRFELPTRLPRGFTPPPDVTASLVIEDRVAARGASIEDGDAVGVRLRGLGPRQVLHLALMEDDGTTWTAAVPVDSAWTERTIPLADFTIGRGVLLPQGFPGDWNYWVGPAEGRGGPGDHVRLAHLERLQFSLRRGSGTGAGGAAGPAAAPQPAGAGSSAPAGAAPAPYGVEIESVTLDFPRPPGR